MDGYVKTEAIARLAGGRIEKWDMAMNAKAVSGMGR
jgi:hypothetical protein